jgi:XRE family transcriptional regulator, regulator of sulfur utilization
MKIPLLIWLSLSCLGASLFAAETAKKTIMQSSVFDWTQLTVVATKAGERRQVFNGPTATLDNFSGHITTLRPGEIAHAPHRHPDEEMVIVKEGTIEVTINGEVRRAGTGSIFFYAPHDLHGIKNIGETNASYFVFRFVTAKTPPKS